MRTLMMALTLLLLTPTLLFAQVDPKLTVIDSHGNAYWNPDNTTRMEAAPGSLFTLLLEGTPGSPYGIYLSLLRTPYPLNIIPPPLLLMPPLFPVIAGPDLLLDPSGNYSFSAYVPPEFSSLGYDVDVYFQGFVQDPTNGFQLTNGITLCVVTPQYSVSLALARGTALNSIAEFGVVADSYANDNRLPAGGGPGLENGEPITPDPDMAGGSTYAFKDDATPPAGTPNPTTSIYLNGIYPLVPGDAGIDNRFSRYPDTGSSLHIYTRDRVCRNMENRYQQHIIAPVFDENGDKTHDLNVYHFRDKSKGEFGFMVVDCLTNDFYELKGTRKPGNSSGSLWDPSVAVSPDGRYMAAVLKDRTGTDITNWNDKLFIIKLVKNDKWNSGDHARKVTINDLGHEKYWVNQVYPESMAFGGAPDPYGLVFLTNKTDTKATKATEPPNDVPASMWILRASGETTKPTYVKFLTSTTLPKAGGGAYPFIYFGSSHFYSSSSKNLSELKWLRTTDNETICYRAAGRASEWDATNEVWLLGGWSWDILSIDNIVVDGNAMTYDIVNATGFPEIGLELGFYIEPFGQTYNGSAKAAIGPPDVGGLSYIAFTAKSYTANYDSENLYVGTTDGSNAGTLQPVTNAAIFKGSFQNDYKMKRGMGIFDPTFVTPTDVVFFCGQNEKASGTYFPQETDFFLYRRSLGEYRNLTQSGYDPEPPNDPIPEPVPPFSVFGTVRPSGIFLSRDGRYVFFLRGEKGGVGKAQKLNLVGVDILSDFTIFDLTGDEFTNGFIPNMDHESITSTGYRWGPEQMSMVLIPTANTDLLFYTGKYQSVPTNKSYQVFMVNMAFPIAAFPVTSYDKSYEGLVDNITADPTGTYLAYSRSNVVDTGSYQEGAFENLYVVDLSQGAYARQLSEDYAAHSRASIDGSFRFIPSLTPSDPPQFVFGMGQGGSALLADNPKKARLWLFPLQSIGKPNVKPIPLTEEDLFLLFNAKPYDGP